MASRGYPDTYEKGKRITGLERVAGGDAKIFHAGTRLVNGEVLSDGGRVLCAVALGDTVARGTRQGLRRGRQGIVGRRLLAHRHRLPRPPARERGGTLASRRPAGERGALVDRAASR